MGSGAAVGKISGLAAGDGSRGVGAGASAGAGESFAASEAAGEGSPPRKTPTATADPTTTATRAAASGIQRFRAPCELGDTGPTVMLEACSLELAPLAVDGSAIGGGAPKLGSGALGGTGPIEIGGSERGTESANEGFVERGEGIALMEGGTAPGASDDRSAGGGVEMLSISFTRTARFERASPATSASQSPTWRGDAMPTRSSRSIANARAVG